MTTELTVTVTQGKIKPKKGYYCTSTSSDGEGKGGVCRRWRAAQAFIRLSVLQNKVHCAQ